MKRTLIRSLAGCVLVLSVTLASCDRQNPVEGNAPNLELMRPQLGPGESNWTPPDTKNSSMQTPSHAGGLFVTNTNVAVDLVAALVVPGPDAPIVSNETFVGAAVAAAIFHGGTGPPNIIGIESGIILSSGNAEHVVGPNVSDSRSTNNGLGGDADLDGLIPGFTTFDAAILEFDFVCEDLQVVSFRYVFSSDEYNEFVFSPFNDVFGFFVNGVNVALLPDRVTPVSINNVNGGNPFGTGNAVNPLFYRNNDLSDGGGAINTEMDGLTVVLTATVPLLPPDLQTGEPVENHIKLAIADAGDRIFDSNVFLEGGTFSCVPPPVVTVIPPGGGPAPVLNEFGVQVGVVIVPAGFFGGQEVVITTQFVGSEDCSIPVAGAAGNCVVITSSIPIPPGTFLIVGLCLTDGSFPPPDFALFRTDGDETVVLQNVFVDLECEPTNGASNLGANPVTRLARGLWRKITGPFRPQVLYATFGDRGAGGLTGFFSDFQNAPQLFVEGAEVTTDEITINGTFDFDGTPFQPQKPQNEDVTITFGECTDPPTCTTNVQFVAAGAAFARTDGDDGWVFRLENGGETRVVISDDDAYDISIEGTDVDGIDLSFVSFIMQIGTRLQGVGLEFNEDGECIRANGTGGCEKPPKEK